MSLTNTSEVIFFLGAGSSIPAGLKDVVKLVDALVEWLTLENQEHLKVTTEIISIIRKWEKDRFDDGYLNIETLLETVEKLEDSFKDVLSSFFKNNEINLQEEGIKLLKNRTLSETIKKFIQIKFHEIKDIGYYEPLNYFISNYKPLKVFTTNYDLIIEQFCNTFKRKYSDLFGVDEWNPEIANSSQFDIILYKLHGSINWYRTEKGKYIRIIAKTNETMIELFTGENAIPLILYPGKKLEYIEPTLEMINLLRKCLFKAKCCFVIGYAFKDEHLRKLFLYSATKNEELIIFLVTPSAHSIYYERLKVHSDKGFPHSFRNESFTAKCYNVTISSDLKGKVIRLPYKFQNIFPELPEYYEQLQKGLYYEKKIKEMKGKINPLIGFLTGESDSNTFTIVDCLECFAKCEYFDKIEEIVNTKTDGWDSIIREMAKTTHFSYHIPNIIDILLKSYFNHSSVEENKDMDKLRYYLQISKEKFKIRIKDFELDLSFLIADIDLTGYHCYRIYDHLEKQFHHYQEIAEVDANDILQIIKKGIEFFKKWKNGKIMLDDYIDNYVTNTAKKQELVNLRQKYKSSNSSDEVTKYSISISNIVETIENEALNIQ